MIVACIDALKRALTYQYLALDACRVQPAGVISACRADFTLQGQGTEIVQEIYEKYAF